MNVRCSSALTSRMSFTRERGTPVACASSCSASQRALSTPAAANRSVAAVSSSSVPTSALTSRPKSLRTGGEPVRGVGIHERGDDCVEVAVEHLVKVVGLESHPVVGDPVLREVVGAHPLTAVDGPDLAGPLGALGCSP